MFPAMLVVECFVRFFYRAFCGISSHKACCGLVSTSLVGLAYNGNSCGRVTSVVGSVNSYLGLFQGLSPPLAFGCGLAEMCHQNSQGLQFSGFPTQGGVKCPQICHFVYMATKIPLYGSLCLQKNENQNAKVGSYDLTF